MNSDLKLFIVIGGAGLISLAFVIEAKLGYARGMYLFKGFPGYPAGYIYGVSPVAISFLVTAFALFLPNQKLASNIVGSSFIIAFISAIILMFLQPRWLKPWWLKWLEDNYKNRLPEILEAARQDNDFQRNTPDEASLAAWAREVASRRGWGG